MTDPSPARTWQVLLIGGAAGTGKTSVSYRLAHHFGIGITEVACAPLGDYFERVIAAIQ